MSDIRRGAFDSELSIQGVTGRPRVWKLICPLIWNGTEGDTFIVPIGFVTDFATVPRFLRWLVEPYGSYTRAAVLHDWLIETRINHPDPELRVSSRDVDAIFRRVMQDLGAWGPLRWTMWAAVRLASLFSPGRRYGRDFRKDALRVLGIGLAVGPFAAIGAIPVALVLGLIRVLRTLTGNPPVR